jgi:DNA-binding CsgD family transcriptional regulator
MRFTQGEIVVQSIHEAKTNQELAEALSFSMSTEKQHLRNIFEKIHVKCRTRLVRYASLVKLVHWWLDLLASPNTVGALGGRGFARAETSAWGLDRESATPALSN